jgi:hypothetical protein
MKGKPLRKNLLNLKLEIASKRNNPPFKMEDLENVLKSLKSKRARGPEE